MEKRHRYLRRVVLEDGAMYASSRCSSMCAEPPVSSARSVNCDLHAYTIFGTRRPCTVSWRGIAPARTSSDCSRSFATYLGHIDIRSTQRYLQMTPELLQAVSQRFAQYAMGADHEG